MSRIAAFGELLAASSVQSRALLLVAAASALLLVFSFAFALFAIRTRLVAARRDRRRAALEAVWTEPTLEALAGERSPEDVHALVDGRDLLVFLDFLVPYAQLVVGEHRERALALAEPFLGAIESALRDRNPFRRARAAQTLGTLGLPDHGAPLVRLLDDPAPFVGMVAAQALARHGRPEDAREFARRLDRFDDWSRGHVVNLLRLIGPSVAPELRAMLEEGGSKSTASRTVALDALRALHDVAAVGIARRLLSEETDEDLLTAALRLVAELGRPADLEAARPHLASEHFPVRAAAFQALGALGAREDLERLLEGIEDPSPWVARQAARGAQLCGGREALRSLARSSHWRSTLAAEVIQEAVP